MQQLINILIFVNFKSDRRACAIPDPDNEEVIFTGGLSIRTRVSVYNKAGHQRDLADLRQGRYFHACSGFIFEEKKVIIETNHFHYYKSLALDGCWRLLWILAWAGHN